MFNSVKKKAFAFIFLTLSTFFALSLFCQENENGTLKSEIISEEIQEEINNNFDDATTEKNENENPENIKENSVSQSLELEKALENVVKSNESFKKEYLNDYMIFDDLEIDQENDYKEIIENPNEKDKFGRTLLMKAAKSGNDWQIKELLVQNADVNLQDNDGWTALMYAVRYQDNLSCVELLLDAGANVKTYNNFNSSALSIAASYNNNPQILKKLLSFYNISDTELVKSFILLLSESNNSEYTVLSKLDIYISSSIPVNAFFQGKTPLMYAAQYGNSTKVIQVLLDNNASKEIRSFEGKTAFDYAKENSKLKHDETFWKLNNK